AIEADAESGERPDQAAEDDVGKLGAGGGSGTERKDRDRRRQDRRQGIAAAEHSGEHRPPPFRSPPRRILRWFTGRQRDGIALASLGCGRALHLWLRGSRSGKCGSYGKILRNFQRSTRK